MYGRVRSAPRTPTHPHPRRLPRTFGRENSLPASCISTSSSERSIPRALHASHLRPLPPFHGRNSKRPSSSTTASFDEGSAPRIPQYSYPRPYLLPNARYPELPLVPIHDRVSSRTLGTQNSPPVPIYIDDCILTLDAESSPPVPGPRPPTSARSHPHLWPNSATNIRHPELQPVLIHGQRPRLPYVRCPELATHLRPPSRAVNSPMNSRHPELPPIPIHGRVLPRNSPPIPVHDRIGRFFPRTLGTQNYNPSLSMAVLYRESSAPRAPTRSPTNAWHLKPSPTHPHPRPLPPSTAASPRKLPTHPRPRPRPPANAHYPEFPPPSTDASRLKRSAPGAPHLSPSTASTFHKRSAANPPRISPPIPVHGRVLPRPLAPRTPHLSQSTDASSSERSAPELPPTAASSHEHSASRAPTRPCLRPCLSANVRHPKLQPILVHVLPTNVRPVRPPRNARHLELPPVPVQGRVPRGAPFRPRPRPRPAANARPPELSTHPRPRPHPPARSGCLFQLRGDDGDNCLHSRYACRGSLSSWSLFCSVFLSICRCFYSCFPFFAVFPAICLLLLCFLPSLLPSFLSCFSLSFSPSCLGSFRPAKSARTSDAAPSLAIYVQGACLDTPLHMTEAHGLGQSRGTGAVNRVYYLSTHMYALWSFSDRISRMIEFRQHFHFFALQALTSIINEQCARQHELSIHRAS